MTEAAKPFTPDWWSMTVRKRKGLGEDDGLIELDEDGNDMTAPGYEAKPSDQLFEEGDVDLTLELMPQELQFIGFKEKGAVTEPPRYSGAGDLDWPAPNHYDPSKRGFQPK